MTKLKPVTPVRWFIVTNDEWVRPPPGRYINEFSFQPTRAIPDGISRLDMRLRNKYVGKGSLIVDKKEVKVNLGRLGLGRPGDKEDMILSIDLRTGIMLTDIGPYRIDDVTLAFFRKKTKWREDTEGKHEVTLPQGARR